MIYFQNHLYKKVTRRSTTEETQDDLLNFNLPNQDLVSPYTNTNIGTSTTPTLQQQMKVNK
ncbi:MAG: hypothetical protein CM15mV51_0880 [uncultured marine virus]|nr:MAG: hypothetical protein CM15mV51_0880 [uncultured marine virus]